MAPRVYLAGPDVFLPDAEAWFARKKTVCAQAGLAAVSPLDPLPGEPAAWSALPEWRRIALRNEAHIRGCDALIANLTPFRGPSADPGTVYEIGFMRALGRPVFGYATTALPFAERTLDCLGLSRDDVVSDGEGMSIEAFGLFDNLMIEGAITDSGGILVVEDCPPARRWTDLHVFERCVRKAARTIMGVFREIDLPKGDCDDETSAGIGTGS
ncbi:MAG: nucleoside 2-deoxyribosyltransferase [Alphaproteobacteria bacterium]|nr:nucleoside 2-deoxyribosyltransferase [Alphaproteobacteria bacterium]